jgi:hypothetical protein
MGAKGPAESMRVSLTVEFTSSRKELSVSKDWLQKHAEALQSQRAEYDYQRSKDSQLVALTPEVWESIRKQMFADVQRLNSIRGNQDVQYTSGVGTFEVKRINCPTISVRANFPDRHIVSYQTTSRYAPDAPQDDTHGHFLFRLDTAGHVRILHKGEMLEDEGSVSEILLAPFLAP